MHTPHTISKKLLLNKDELNAIKDLEIFIHLTSQVYLHQYQDYKERSANLIALKSGADDPMNFFDAILLMGEDESRISYSTRVMQELARLKDIKFSPFDPRFISSLENKFKTILADDEVLAEDLYSNLYLQLEQCIEEYPSPVISENLSLLEEEQGMQNLLLSDLRDNFEKVHEAIMAYTDKLGLKIELDENFNIIKIFRNKLPSSFRLSHSVLYTKDAEKISRLALFPGKDGKILGQGSFGRVKFAQELDTGHWRAIKIIDESTLAEEENHILKKLDRFWGEQSRRNKKHYTAQSLIPGLNLEDYIKTIEHPDSSLYLDIAQKILETVIHFHDQGFLHRDIKPGNFIWDQESRSLELCDFGMSVQLKPGETQIRALSGCGTQEFMAPEIQEDLHSGLVFYNVQTDAYAVGKTLEMLLSDLKDLPSIFAEVYAGLCHPSPDRRLDLHEALELIKSQKGLSSSIK